MSLVASELVGNTIARSLGDMLEDSFLDTTGWGLKDFTQSCFSKVGF